MAALFPVKSYFLRSAPWKKQQFKYHPTKILWKWHLYGADETRDRLERFFAVVVGQRPRVEIVAEASFRTRVLKEDPVSAEPGKEC